MDKLVWSADGMTPATEDDKEVFIHVRELEALSRQHDFMRRQTIATMLLLVSAAGGLLRVPKRVQQNLNPDDRLIIEQDPRTGDVVYRVEKKYAIQLLS